MIDIQCVCRIVFLLLPSEFSGLFQDGFPRTHRALLSSASAALGSKGVNLPCLNKMTFSLRVITCRVASPTVGHN